jgi:hypothetical protein
LTDADTPQQFSDVTPNQDYTITESVPSGWSLVTSGTGCVATTDGVTIMPAPGEDVSCVFTDTKLASITIDKTAVGGDETFVFSEATLGDLSVSTSGGSGSATYVDVPPGSYTFVETPQLGWVAGPFGDDCDSDGSVTVLAGGTVTCSITNTKLAPAVTPNPARVAPGGIVVLALRGFPPNSALTVSVVGAGGTRLGPFSVQSDANGEASLPVSLPADSPAGEYQVAVSGAGFTTVGTSFVVVAPATTTTTTAAPVAVAAKEVTPTQTGFAFTGSRASDLATLAAVLLACGLGALYAVRRRRQRGHAA